MLVSQDFQIPLFHKVYQGNKSDKGVFIQVANELVEWQSKHLGHTNETTIIFDKGNVSDDAINRLIVGEQNYVCAVPKSTNRALYSTSIEKMKYVPGLPGTRAHSDWIQIWNKKHKAVVSYSDSYFATSVADLMEKLRKCEEKLHELDSYLAQAPQRPQDEKFYTKGHIQKRISMIISHPRVEEVMHVKIKKIKGRWRLEYGISQEKLDQLMKADLGRTLIISSRLDWDEKEIISNYRSQQGIENVFKHMKNKDYLHWHPEFHWTDSKIKVHGLYCVIAMLLASLAHRIVKQNGLELSLIQMLEELNEVREVALIYKNPKKTDKNQIVLSRQTPMQKKLTEILEVPMVLWG